MAADGVHGTIGKLLKTSVVATFEDFEILCERSQKNIKVIRLELPYIYSVTKENRCRNTKKVTMPMLKCIVNIKFTKGSTKAFFKSAFTDFLKSKFVKAVGPRTVPAVIEAKRYIVCKEARNHWHLKRNTIGKKKILGKFTRK